MLFSNVVWMFTRDDVNRLITFLSTLQGPPGLNGYAGVDGGWVSCIQTRKV